MDLNYTWKQDLLAKFIVAFSNSEDVALVDTEGILKRHCVQISLLGIWQAVKQFFVKLFVEDEQSHFLAVEHLLYCL
jgi:hypothetical protein